MRALLVRGGAVWQLVGLITRRSQVQILPPLPIQALPYCDPRCGVFLQAQSATLSMLNSVSTLTFSARASFNARTIEGTMWPISIALIDLRVTLASSASSA